MKYPELIVEPMKTFQILYRNNQGQHLIEERSSSENAVRIKFGTLKESKGAVIITVIPVPSNRNEKW